MLQKHPTWCYTRVVRLASSYQTTVEDLYPSRRILGKLEGLPSNLPPEELYYAASKS